MEIASIEAKSNYYEIIIEKDKYLLTYEELESLELYVGKEIDFESYKKIVDTSNFNEVELKARNYSLKRIVSSIKLKEYLMKYNLTSEEKEKIIDNLNELGLINDSIYLEGLIYNKKLSNSYSRNKLISYLKFEGYPMELIEEKMIAYSEEEEFSKMQEIFARKYKNYDKTDKKVQYKIKNYFLSNLYPLDKVNLLFEED